jgi:hypothetical protein
VIPLTPTQIAAFDALARQNRGDVHVDITVRASGISPEHTAEFVRKHGRAILKAISRGVTS